MDNYDTVQFITEVERRPPLWNSSIEEYSNRELRKQSWDEIVEIFGGKNLTATQRRDIEVILQKKWKGVRGCYTRELKRQERVMAGNNPGPRKSEYTYFQHLQFLRGIAISKESEQADYIYFDTPDVKLKQVKTEIAHDEVDSDGDGIIFGDEIDGKKDESDKNDDDPLKHDFQIKKRKRNREDDEDKMFLLSLLSAMKSIPTSRKMTTRIKLLKVLDEATRDVNE